MSQLVSRASRDLDGCVTVAMGRCRDMVSPATVLFFIIIVVIIVDIIIIITIKAEPQMSQLVSKSTKELAEGGGRGERGIMIISVIAYIIRSCYGNLDW